MITSSSPTAMSRFAMTVMRESAVRWSRCRTEMFGLQLWLRWECNVYKPPCASRSIVSSFVRVHFILLMMTRTMKDHALRLIRPSP